MSSDPGAPDIKEVFSNDSSKLDKDQTHYNLIPTSDQPTQHEHREKPENPQYSTIHFAAGDHLIINNEFNR